MDPIVLQISNEWHIVEHSRRSEHAMCGRRVTNRGAHARFSQVGINHACPKCVKIFQQLHPNNSLARNEH